MYPSTAALVADSSVDALTGLDSNAQDALREQAITAVENYCGQTFTSQGTAEDPETRNVDGSGSKVLQLPARLSALDSVIVRGSSLTEDEITLADDHSKLVVVDPAVGNYYTRALADVSEPSFLRGSANVAVAGVWGWTDDDYTAELDAVTLALRLDMEDAALADAHALTATVSTARRLGLASVDQGNLSLTLTERPPDALSPRAQRTLAGRTPGTRERLIWTPAHGAVV